MKKSLLTKAAFTAILAFAATNTSILHATNNNFAFPAGDHLCRMVMEPTANGLFTLPIASPRSKLVEKHNDAHALLTGAIGAVPGLAWAASWGFDPLNITVAVLGFCLLLNSYVDVTTSDVVRHYATARKTFDDVAEKLGSFVLLDLGEASNASFRAEILVGKVALPITKSITLLYEMVQQLNTAKHALDRASKTATSEEAADACRDLQECNDQLLRRTLNIIEFFKHSDEYAAEKAKNIY